MGAHIVRGTETHAPEFGFNSCPAPEWGGKALADFSEFDGWRMRRFVEEEAYRRGYNDANNDLQADTFNPFHSRFLFGEPRHTWSKLYLFGHSDRRAGAGYFVPNSLDLEVCPVEYSLWPNIVAALKETAEDFEAAYRKLGIEKKSILRGTMAALVGWFNAQEGEFSPILEDEELNPV